jgi:hypothetical protein
MKPKQSDLADGIFDDEELGLRIVFREGRPGPFAGKHSCGNAARDVHYALREPWGAHPGLPEHLRRVVMRELDITEAA